MIKIEESQALKEKDTRKKHKKNIEEQRKKRTDDAHGFKPKYIHLKNRRSCHHLRPDSTLENLFFVLKGEYIALMRFVDFNNLYIEIW